MKRSWVGAVALAAMLSCGGGLHINVFSNDWTDDGGASISSACGSV